ncbi:MAG: hypothetical protein P1U63_11500 [Coxiellaceae bacterium]|nr:hypothetical protein [Coxiellaceae bacterium]
MRRAPFKTTNRAVAAAVAILSGKPPTPPQFALLIAATAATVAKASTESKQQTVPVYSFSPRMGH